MYTEHEKTLFHDIIQFQSFKVYFNDIPEGHRAMWIYTMYAGMSTGKYND